MIGVQCIYCKVFKKLRNRFWCSERHFLKYEIELPYIFSPNDNNHGNCSLLLCLTGLSFPCLWIADGVIMMATEIPSDLWRMNFQNHRIVPGKVTEDQTKSPTEKSVGLFSVQGLYFRKQNRSLKEIFVDNGNTFSVKRFNRVVFGQLSFKPPEKNIGSV